jgi:hypothetical protein
MGLNISNIFNFAKLIGPVKNLLAKLKIPLMVIVGVLVVGICGFGLYKWISGLTSSAVSAAHSQGVAETNNATALAANKAMLDAIQNLQKLEADTNKKLSDLRTENVKEKKSIDSYDAKDIAIKHPEEVEKWANDTTTGLFNDIQTETTLKAQGDGQ